MSNTAISDYALLSDCHSAALVSREGSVDWLCFPRFDSPSLFARLLDRGAGHWSIRPSGPFTATRRYVDRTLVLETTFETKTGAVRLVDALAIGHHERGHSLGEHSPHALLRRVEGLRGSVELEIEYAPRGEYGLVHPLLERTPEGVDGRAGADFLRLSSTLRPSIDDSTARATLTVGEGQTVCFALQQRPSWTPDPSPWSQEEISRRLEDTAEAWRTWADMHQSYEGPWRDLVHHSGRVLQALTFQPTGAIVAAATTSLPEWPGGGRNWDYRYAWIRDASLTLSALWVAACPDEAHRFFDFIAGASMTQVRRNTDLQIMFGVGGEHDLFERELTRLEGWRGSRPVRLGNGAWDQRQLDVYGQLLDASWRLKDQLSDMGPLTREFLVAVADEAADRWRDPDQGIWEVRGGPRDFVYSKLMCWVALDRAIRLADLLEATHRCQDWEAARDEIRAAILERGWSDRAGSFVQAFGSDDLDASNLVMPIVGFLPADDPRVRATLHAVVQHLTDERGLVYRYRSPDGVEGEEGSFVLCSFWLAHAQALAGELEDARATFERAAAYANDVGLLAEEVDPRSGELLGNFPQAFSHVGLVNAAWAISQAEERSFSDSDAGRSQAAEPQGPLP